MGPVVDGISTLLLRGGVRALCGSPAMYTSATWRLPVATKSASILARKRQLIARGEGTHFRPLQNVQLRTGLSRRLLWEAACAIASVAPLRLCQRVAKQVMNRGWPTCVIALLCVPFARPLPANRSTSGGGVSDRKNSRPKDAISAVRNQEAARGQDMTGKVRQPGKRLGAKVVSVSLHQRNCQNLGLSLSSSNLRCSPPFFSFLAVILELQSSSAQA